MVDVGYACECYTAREPLLSFSNGEINLAERVRSKHAFPPAEIGFGSDFIRTGKLSSSRSFPLIV